MGTLAELVKSTGSTLSAVALKVGVDPELLARVDAGDQPLPIEVVESIASVLGLDIGTVSRATPSVALQRGNAVGLRPVPQRDLWVNGQPPTQQSAVLARTVAVVRPPPPTPPVPVLRTLWATNLFDNSITRFDLEGMTEVAIIPMTIGEIDGTPIYMAYARGLVWIACTARSETGGALCVVNPASNTQVATYTNESINIPFKPVYVPTLGDSGTIALLCFDGTLVRFDIATATVLNAVGVTEENFGKDLILGEDGFLYVLYYNSSLETEVVAKFNPATWSVVGTTTDSFQPAGALVAVGGKIQSIAGFGPFEFTP